MRNRHTHKNYTGQFGHVRLHPEKPAYILYSKFFHGMLTTLFMLGASILIFAYTIFASWSTGPLIGKDAMQAFIMTYGGCCMCAPYITNKTFMLQLWWGQKFVATTIMRLRFTNKG